MRPNVFTALFSLVSVLLFAHSAAAIAPSSLTNLITFGDSLVDAGNTQNALGGPGGVPCGTPPCDPTPDSFGYFEGRFSNGPTGADVLNQAITGSLSVESTLGGSNYSYGGARAVGGSLPDVSTQVSGIYLPTAGGIADPGALYLINIGGNDVRDQVHATAGGTATLTDQQVIDAVVAAITTQVAALQNAGAVHILVNGVGDVGGIPETATFGAAAQAHGTALSQDMSNQIFAALDPSIYTLDVIGLFAAAQANPVLFGLPPGLNTTGSCLPDGPPPACSNFAFFDPVHPTDALHSILGGAMIAAIPEPGTGILLAIGLIGLGARRKA